MARIDGLLSHISVLDLTQDKAGSYCTRLMAEYGAEVIKVEPPVTGDPCRHFGPFINNAIGLETSTLFHWLNPGKLSITLDLVNPKSLDILKPLLQDADVLVESFKPGVLAQLGLTKSVLDSINPRLITTSISNFGSNGPYRDYESSDIVHHALSGAMYLTGDDEKPPLNSGPAVTAYTAGLHAYIGTLMAFFRRHDDPLGETVEVSIHESSLENIEIKLVEALHHGKTPCRNNDQHLFSPWKCYPTADGYVAAIGGPMRHWRRAASMFQDARLTTPPLDQIAGRVQHRQTIESILAPWFQKQEKRDVHRQGQEQGLAFAYLADMAEAFEWPQHRSREFIQPAEPHPHVGVLNTCSVPFRPSGNYAQPQRAPLLGEHNSSIYIDRLGYSGETIKDWYTTGII
jgi:crotonobetainyl-CoA:carnitine CoA-transferase CaiB-like acyl-CoA transferase